MSYEQQALADGFAYCEVRNIYNKTKEGAPLTSKKGDPMITVQWSVVDKEGNHGTVKDYLVSSAFWKIDNLENVLAITGLFNKITNTFNTTLLLRKACGASIKQDENPQYGSKIVMYVPLGFFYLLNSAEREAAQPNQEKLASSSPITRTSDVKDIDDDFLPF